MLIVRQRSPSTSCPNVESLFTWLSLLLPATQCRHGQHLDKPVHSGGEETHGRAVLTRFGCLRNAPASAGVFGGGAGAILVLW